MSFGVHSRMMDMKMTLSGTKPSSFSVKDILDLPDAKSSIPPAETAQATGVVSPVTGKFSTALSLHHYQQKLV